MREQFPTLRLTGFLTSKLGKACGLRNGREIVPKRRGIGAVPWIVEGDDGREYGLLRGEFLELSKEGAHDGN